MKKTFTLFAALGLTMGAFAQSFTLSETTPWVAGTVDEIIHSYGDLTNDAASTKQVHCKRENIDVGAGTSNYFCWTQCYGPMTDESPVPYPMDANAMTEIFAGYYNANGFVGYSIVRYTFFDTLNVSDEISFDVTYSTDPNGIADGFVSGTNGLSASYPNPANASTEMVYSLKPDANRASVEMFNMLGSKVRSIPLTEKNGALKVDLSAIPSGLYFFNMVVDGKTLETRKLMVAH
ncbi:MAG: hypothetical protein ACI9YU_000405 [Flavobacteriales bacterium]|jgi:hypothetical protein